MTWKRTDPREEVFRGPIAIVEGGNMFGGYVETDHGYYVSLDHNRLDRRSVGENDKWPGWLWITVPRWPRV